MKPLAFSLILGLSLLGIHSARAASTVVINFGNSNSAITNNYTAPNVADYGAGAGNFTTSVTGTTGASGTSYNTVQQFKDEAGDDLALTLNLRRSGAKVYTQPGIAFNNSVAINDMVTTLGSFDTTTLGSFISPGGGGTRFESITLNNVSDGLSSYDATFYFALSSLDGALTSVTVTGATGTLEYAGQDGSGFVGTLAESGPGSLEITLVKWTGSFAAGETSLTVALGGSKAGVSTIAYVIPEPSGFALLGLSAFGLVLRRRR